MKLTILNEIHNQLGAKMVEFAGYSMPVQYKDGMLKEHEWVRNGNVGIFDVSHMGQFLIEGEGVDQFLSYITPTDFKLSADNLAKYTVLTNPSGGIIDDLIVTKINNHKFFMVLNAGCKEKDAAWIKQNLPSNIKFSELDSRSLIAIQGQKSEEVLQSLIKDGNLSNLNYMHMQTYHLKNDGQEVYISRTGYTGEDGFEVSIANSATIDFWQKLSSFDAVKPIGLGARDSLRLEMGYPLYGHDLDETISPIEAGISWVVSKSSQNFIGADIILSQKNSGQVKKKRVGIKLLDRQIARQDMEVVNNEGKKIGQLTSGGFSPTLKTSIGQAYIDSNLATIGQEVSVIIRGNKVPAIIHLPNFVAAKTKAKKIITFK
jgi:aminomethyltransferase